MSCATLFYCNSSNTFKIQPPMLEFMTKDFKEKVSISHSTTEYASWNNCSSDFSPLNQTTWMRVAVWSEVFKLNNDLVDLLE